MTMHVTLPRVHILLLSLVVVMGSLSLALSQERVRATIGIQIKTNDQSIRAKKRDQLKAGDFLRIYVLPETCSHVYVVHSDQQQVVLLNKGKEKILEFGLVLPSPGTFYQVDGKSPFEVFTIICSPTELPEVEALFQKEEVSATQWVALEEPLINKSKISLSQTTEKPFPLAGNVRGGPNPLQTDPFVKELQTFSGESLVVKRYEFTVKK
jgi:hypothetical protein